MKHKLVFLSATYSKQVVETINGYFDQGYEIKDILSANDGCYLLLILKGGESYTYKYAKMPNKCELLEEEQGWVRTSTQDVKPN